MPLQGDGLPLQGDGLVVDANFKIPEGCASASHPVRVLECIYLPAELHGKKIDPSDTANWVVRCQSAISEFNGPSTWTQLGAVFYRSFGPSNAVCLWSSLPWEADRLIVAR